jgi:peptide/nickel transport system permease protein
MALMLLSIIFVTIRVLPGDPTLGALPAEAPAEARIKLAKELGLEKPYVVQYLDFVASVFTGRLGMSWAERRPVSEVLYAAFPTTVELTLAGMTVAVIIGLMVGVLSALERDSIVDIVLRFLTTFWYSVPIIWLGPIMQLLFGIYLGVLPVSGRIDLALAPPRITGFVFLDSLWAGSAPALLSALRHMILPSVTLGLVIMSLIARITRSSLIQVLEEDYILTATAKGLSQGRIVMRHGLRNASFPVITIIGLEFGTLLTGAVITERIFNLPGMGSAIIRAFFARDVALMQGALALAVLWTALVTIVLDFLYIALDPRVRTV